MPDKLRHRTVAVVVYHDPKLEFLLWHNHRWGGYALPMKHVEPGGDPAEAALNAITDRDFPLSWPHATVAPLACTGEFGISEGTKEKTYYDYHVYELDPGQTLNPADLPPDLSFFSYEQLQSASNVTWSTREITKALVESQEVAVAVVSRQCGAEREFLLIHNRHYGYFFPSIRRKTNASLEAMAVQSMRFDTGYPGEVTAHYGREVLDVHLSTRFGPRQRQYQFYLLKVHCPGVELCRAGNALEQSLDAMQAARAAAGQVFGSRGYWSWFTADEMRTRADMSSDIAVVLSAAVACAEMPAA